MPSSRAAAPQQLDEHSDSDDQLDALVRSLMKDVTDTPRQRRRSSAAMWSAGGIENSGGGGVGTAGAGSSSDEDEDGEEEEEEEEVLPYLDSDPFDRLPARSPPRRKPQPHVASTSRVARRARFLPALRTTGVATAPRLHTQRRRRVAVTDGTVQSIAWRRLDFFDAVRRHEQEQRAAQVRRPPPLPRGAASRLPPLSAGAATLVDGGTGGGGGTGNGGGNSSGRGGGAGSGDDSSSATAALSPRQAFIASCAKLAVVPEPLGGEGSARATQREGGDGVLDLTGFAAGDDLMLALAARLTAEAEAAKAAAVALDSGSDDDAPVRASRGARGALPPPPRPRVLSALRLADNRVTARSARSLIKAVQANGTVLELDLARNTIGAEGAAALAELLAGHPVSALQPTPPPPRAAAAPAPPEADAAARPPHRAAQAPASGDSPAKTPPTFARRAALVPATTPPLGGHTARSGSTLALPVRPSPPARMGRRDTLAPPSRPAPAAHGSLWRPRVACALRVLNLAGNSLDARSVQRLAAAALACRSLTDLDLSDNAIGQPCAAALATLLTRSGTLQRLSLAWNALRGEAAEQLLHALRVNVSLLHLDLAWNPLDSPTSDHRACRALGDALAHNHTLLHLDVSHTGVTADGCRLLAAGMAHNGSLTALHFTGNAAGEEAPVPDPASTWADGLPMQTGVYTRCVPSCPLRARRPRADAHPRSVAGAASIRSCTSTCGGGRRQRAGCATVGTCARSSTARQPLALHRRRA